MNAATALDLIVRSAVVYLALLVVLRVFGKREVGQFTLHDLVFILVVANAVQPAVTGPDSSLTGGIVIILTLATLNLAVARLEQLRLFHRYLVPTPTVVVEGAATWKTGCGASKSIASCARKTKRPRALARRSRF